jgi:hypothetical protein
MNVGEILWIMLIGGALGYCIGMLHAAMNLHVEHSQNRRQDGG